MLDDLQEVIYGDDNVEELADGPCPHCGEIMLEEIKNHGMDCISEETGKADIIFVSGLKCAHCSEIFFDSASAEIYMNTMLKLDDEAEPGKKYFLTATGPEKATIH